MSVYSVSNVNFLLALIRIQLSLKQSRWELMFMACCWTCGSHAVSPLSDIERKVCVCGGVCVCVLLLCVGMGDCECCWASWILFVCLLLVLITYSFRLDSTLVNYMMVKSYLHSLLCCKSCFACNKQRKSFFASDAKISQTFIFINFPLPEFSFISLILAISTSSNLF
jgi:hypothetical protein